MIVPRAFIDEPGPDAPLAEWLAWRLELDTLNIEGLAPFKARADAMIARLIRSQLDSNER